MNLHAPIARIAALQTALEQLRLWADAQPIWACFAVMTVAAVALLLLLWLLPSARSRRREARQHQADRNLFE
jgi:membrane protein YdbS with pleckstrin-like domain